MMANFEFDLIFALPGGEFDVMDLSDAVFAVGFEDAVIGSGRLHAGLLAVAIDVEGGAAESVIVGTARRILSALPKGTSLREVRPDMVSLADVAGKLKVKRQALQKRDMPPPYFPGYYRVTEVAATIQAQMAKSSRRPRFDIEAARPWFAAGQGAQDVNARLVLGQVDGASLVYTGPHEPPAAYRF